MTQLRHRNTAQNQRAQSLQGGFEFPVYRKGGKGSTRGKDALHTSHIQRVGSLTRSLTLARGRTPRHENAKVSTSTNACAFGIQAQDVEALLICTSQNRKIFEIGARSCTDITRLESLASRHISGSVTTLTRGQLPLTREISGLLGDLIVRQEPAFAGKYNCFICVDTSTAPITKLEPAPCSSSHFTHGTLGSSTNYTRSWFTEDTCWWPT